MKLRVWISAELAGAARSGSMAGGYVDHQSRAILTRWGDDGSLTILCINQRYELAKSTKYAAGHWLAVEDLQLPSKVVSEKVKRLVLPYLDSFNLR